MRIFVNLGDPMKTLIVVVSIVLSLALPLYAQSPAKIVKIDITGNERVDKGEIMGAVKTKVNDPYDQNKLREDLKNIYKIGYFSDVQLDVRDNEKGKIVTFVVIERPTVKNIYLTGNKKITTSDIREKLKIETNKVLNTEKVRASIEEIRKHYISKGYPNVSVSYEIEYGEGYDASVKFTIEEPPQAFVKKITFTGNKAFKDSKLKDYMRTKEKGLLSFFTGSGILDEEGLDDDRKNIEAFYADNGYVRAKVGTPEVKFSKDGTQISILLPIDEGDVYKVDKIDFTGDMLLSKDELLKKIKTRPGTTFMASRYQQDILVLTDIYQDMGYAFCEVSPLTLIDDNARTMNITFDISKGEEIYFNRINVIGNIRTRDKVIRRELTFAEGDRFSSTKLKSSQRKLRNTTYFKNVDMKIQKTDEPDKINLDVAVEEKPTGTFNVGVGYSTSDKMIFTGSVSQENFLGTGRKLFLEAAVSGVTQDFRFSYVEPYLFDYKLAGGLNVYNYGREMDGYDYTKRGGGFSLTRPLTDDVRLGLAYQFDVTRVSNITYNTSPYIWEQRGTRTASGITASLTENSIDDVMNPMSGVVSQLSLNFTGIGGNTKYVRAVASYGRYIPAGFWNSTFFLRATAGTIRQWGGEKIPVYERFYVGGLNTVRGFKYGEAGPRDIAIGCTTRIDNGKVVCDQLYPYEGDYIGGLNQFFINAEWIFPIYKPAGIKGVVFFDYGGAFDKFSTNMLRPAAGLGIRWLSPMGLIRLELGFNLSPKKGERASVFDFNVGTQY